MRRSRGWLLLSLLLLLPAWLAAQSASVPLAGLRDGRTPLTLDHPLNRAVVGAWQVLPGLSGGATWYNLAAPYHGTLLNMATAGGTSGWGSTTRTGGLGELRLDGTNDYVSIGVIGAYDFPNQQFTVSLCHRSTAAAQAYLVTRRHSACASLCGGWFLRINSSGTYEARVVNTNNTNAAARVSVTTTANNGDWHHVAVVFTTNTTTLASNDVALYHNGVLDQAARTDSGAGAYYLSPYALVFGATSDAAAGGFLAGALDAVWIFNRGLSAEEIGGLRRTCTGENPLLAARPLAVPSSAIAGEGRASRGRVF